MRRTIRSQTRVTKKTRKSKARNTTSASKRQTSTTPTWSGVFPSSVQRKSPRLLMHRTGYRSAKEILDVNDTHIQVNESLVVPKTFIRDIYTTHGIVEFNNGLC